MFEFLLLLVFPAAMAFAGAMDLLTMTIPNRISIVLVATFAVVAVYSGMPVGTLVNAHIAVGGAVLVAGIVMFAVGWMGGGDAKLLAAGALWFGYGQLPEFLFLVSVLGGVLALVILAYRHMVPAVVMVPPVPVWAQNLHVGGSGIPYGIAIAGASLILYPKSSWFTMLLH